MGQEWKKWTAKNTASTVCEDLLQILSSSCTQNVNIQRRKSLWVQRSQRIFTDTATTGEHGRVNMAPSLNSENKKLLKKNKPSSDVTCETSGALTVMWVYSLNS